MSCFKKNCCLQTNRIEWFPESIFYFALQWGGSATRSQRLVKMNLYFTLKFRNCLDQFRKPIGLRTCSTRICNTSSNSPCSAHKPFVWWRFGYCCLRSRTRTLKFKPKLTIGCCQSTGTTTKLDKKSQSQSTHVTFSVH